jgi:phosphatidylserine decarboxylase
MEVELADGRRIVVTQITGLIARRIVCHAKVGEWIPRGARYGLIRFGSRTDVLLPPGSVASEKPGDRVKGGASIIARLGAAE